MRIRSAVLSLFVVAVMAASTALAGAAPASASTTRAARMIAKINAARASHGLPALKPSSDLMAAARAHSASMAGSSSLFHTASFTGLCCWRSIAENVGYGFSVAGLNNQFMSSPLHKANILDPRMRQVGVGFVRRGDALWVTEVFRAPR